VSIVELFLDVIIFLLKFFKFVFDFELLNVWLRDGVKLKIVNKDLSVNVCGVWLLNGVEIVVVVEDLMVSGVDALMIVDVLSGSDALLRISVGLIIVDENVLVSGCVVTKSAKKDIGMADVLHQI